MHCSEGLHNPSSLNSFQHNFFHKNIYIWPIYTFWESTKFYTGILGEKYPIMIFFHWSVRELHCNLQHNSLPLLIPLQAYCWCSQRHAGPFHGKEHPHAPIMLAAKRLESTVAEKDLGVLVDTELSMSQQSTLPARKASSLLGCPGKSTISRLRDMMLPL